MFSVIRLRQALTQAPRNIFNVSARGIVLKKSAWDRLRLRFTIRPPSFQKIQNSKLTPEGYTVIYVSPLYHHLNIGHILLTTAWPLVFTHFYFYFKFPETTKERLKFFHSSEAGFAFIIIAVPIALHWFLLRNVRVVFQKNNQYKSLIYGIFGPLRKIYVDHGKYAYEKTNLSSLFHVLKNRKLIIFQEGFKNEMDYLSLVIIQNRDQGYL